MLAVLAFKAQRGTVNLFTIKDTIEWSSTHAYRYTSAFEGAPAGMAPMVMTGASGMLSVF